MAQNTSIEWTLDTANIFYAVDAATRRRGWICVKYGEDCENCYAEQLNKGFFQFGTGHPYAVSSLRHVDLQFDRETARGWSRKRLPRTVFVNSMTDTFGEFYPDEWVLDLLDYMAQAPLHTFQVLTKRAKRMYEIVTAWLRDRREGRVPNHIHLIVSAGTQQLAEKRIPWLQKLPCTRGLSVEPLLGPIPSLPLAGIGWVIVGGESGPGARSDVSPIGCATFVISASPPAYRSSSSNGENARTTRIRATLQRRKMAARPKEAVFSMDGPGTMCPKCARWRVHRLSGGHLRLIPGCVSCTVAFSLQRPPLASGHHVRNDL
jgi:protein gp37